MRKLIPRQLTKLDPEDAGPSNAIPTQTGPGTDPLRSIKGHKLFLYASA